MKKGIEKDRILSPDDAQLLGKFFNKLLKEINQNQGFGFLFECFLMQFANKIIY